MDVNAIDVTGVPGELAHQVEELAAENVKRVHRAPDADPFDAGPRARTRSRRSWSSRPSGTRWAPERFAATPFRAPGPSCPPWPTRRAALERGEALEAGDWAACAAAFEAALERDPSPGRARGARAGALVASELAPRCRTSSARYAGHRETGMTSRGPPRRALWLSREFQAVYGNAAESNGWYAPAIGPASDTARRARAGMAGAHPRRTDGRSPAEMARPCRGGARDRDPRGRSRSRDRCSRPSGLRGGGRRRRRPRPRHQRKSSSEALFGTSKRASLASHGPGVRLAADPVDRRGVRPSSAAGARAASRAVSGRRRRGISRSCA